MYNILTFRSVYVRNFYIISIRIFVEVQQYQKSVSSIPLKGTKEWTFHKSNGGYVNLDVSVKADYEYVKENDTVKVSNIKINMVEGTPENHSNRDTNSPGFWDSFFVLRGDSQLPTTYSWAEGMSYTKGTMDLAELDNFNGGKLIVTKILKANPGTLAGFANDNRWDNYFIDYKTNLQNEEFTVKRGEDGKFKLFEAAVRYRSSHKDGSDDLQDPEFWNAPVQYPFWKYDSIQMSIDVPKAPTINTKLTNVALQQIKSPTFLANQLSFNFILYIYLHF